MSLSIKKYLIFLKYNIFCLENYSYHEVLIGKPNNIA